MFKSKEKKAASAANKAFTATGLLKAAISHDQDAMTKMVTGQTADDEGIRFALEMFLGVAHRNPAIVTRLGEIATTAPDKVQLAFSTGILAARTDNFRAFQGGSVFGQGAFIMALAAAISENNAALADAMATVKLFAERGGK